MLDNRSSPTTDKIIETMESIKQVVNAFYQGLDKWHNIDHGARVVAAAIEINKFEQADPFLVEAGAWLHQYHRPNLHLLEPVLESLNVSDQQRRDLRDIVAVCRPDLIGTRPEGISDSAWKAAQVVFDADALDLIGPSGIFREVSCNMVARSKSHGEALTLAREVHDMFADKLQTQAGRALAASGIAAVKDLWSEFDRHEAFLHERGARPY